MKKFKFKLNKDLNGFKAGRVIGIACDDDGIPLDAFWFRRLKDAKIDNCIELVNEKPAAKEKKATTTQKVTNNDND